MMDMLRDPIWQFFLTISGLFLTVYIFYRETYKKSKVLKLEIEYHTPHNPYLLRRVKNHLFYNNNYYADYALLDITITNISRSPLIPSEFHGNIDIQTNHEIIGIYNFDSSKIEIETKIIEIKKISIKPFLLNPKESLFIILYINNYENNKNDDIKINIRVPDLKIKTIYLKNISYKELVLIKKIILSLLGLFVFFLALVAFLSLFMSSKDRMEALQDIHIRLSVLSAIIIFPVVFFMTRNRTP